MNHFSRGYHLEKSGSFKVSAFVLAFLLLISPVAQVFASDETPAVTSDTSSPTVPQSPTMSTSSTTPTTEGTTQSTPVAPTTTDSSVAPASTPDTGVSQTPTSTSTASTDATKSTTTTVDPNAKVLPAASKTLPPNQPGLASAIQKVTPQPDPSTGALTYSYPITVPPGRNGMQPDIGLQYNSQTLDQDSPLGYGWTTSIPYIKRVNKTGTDRLYTDNYFSSSMSGDLVNISGASYDPRSEKGDFQKYTYASNTWTVTDKSGTVYTFGSVAATRQDNPSDSTQIYKWMLEKVQDTNGNFITYTYYKDAGQIYPNTIVYTSNGANTGIFEVDFLRQSRTDTTISASAGFSTTTNYRIYEVDTKVSGTWVSKYAIAYTTGANGVKSVLHSITQSGQDSLGVVTTLPATVISYQSTAPGFTSTTNWALPNTLTSTWNATVQTQFVDLNGDGLPDLVQSVTENTGSGYVLENAEYLNTGSGWSSTSSWALPNTLPSGYTSPVSTQFVDLNGDGLPDLIEYITSGSVLYSDVYLNTGSGWGALNTTWTIPNTFASTSSTSGQLQFADLNGDGLPDLIEYVYAVTVGGPTLENAVYLNNGNGWTSNTSFVLPNTFTATYGGIGQIQFTDLNGDGLLDYVESVASNTGSGYVLENMEYLNNGNGWTTNTSWALPNTLTATWNTTILQQFIDLNGDGLPDLMQYLTFAGVLYSMPYINTGAGWTAASSSWNLPTTFTSTWNTTVQEQFADLNGDGLPDLTQSVTENTGSLVLESAVYVNSGQVDDLMSQTTYPEGGSNSITYKATPQYVDGSSNLLNPHTPFVLQTTSQIVLNDGFGNTATTSYVYAGGSYFFNASDLTTRRFAGFTSITTTDPAGNVTKTYYHTGNGTDTTHGEYADSYPKIGQVYRTENYDGSNNLYAVTINKWDDYNIGTNHDFVKLARSTTLTYDGTGSHKDTAVEYTYDNTYGNVLTKTNWGQVTAANDGSFTDTGTDKSIETISYVAGTGNYVVGLPYDDVTVDQSAAKVNETRTYYDTLALGSVGVGNPTKVEKWVTGTTYVNTQKAYDGTYGIVVTATDENGHSTNYTFDTYHLYPTTVTDALTHATGYTYDYSSGKVIQTTDQNGFIYQTIYDGLNRVIQQNIPGFTTPYTPVTKATLTYTDTTGAVSVHEVDSLDGTNTVDTYSYYDGLNRLIQKRVESETAGSYNVTDYAYNNLGLIQKQSLPYLSSGSAKTTATTTTALYNSFTYDPIERVLSSVNALGTTSYVYNLWKTSVTDPRGKVKDEYADARGNLIEVDEHNSSSTYVTTYTWNLNGNLLSITDALGNVRHFTYDGLGDRLTAEDLHATADSTYGSWSYAYDSVGNLTQSISPLSKTVNYTYDNVSRILTEDYTGGTGTEINYVYDTCTNGIGKLCSVTMTSGANTTYTYDSNSNIASQAKTINSTAYTTSFTYDRQGNQLVITYPDSSAVSYTYNTAGLLSQVQTKESGGSYANVVSSITHTPTNQPAVITYANGVVTTNTYDASHLYRLSTKVTVNSVPTNLQNITYSYDANDNITQINDASATHAAKTVVYTYDDLNRMLTATATGVPTGQTPYTHTFVYNAIGDITSGPVGTYIYNGSTGTNYANPHAATSINGVTNTYDKDGNVLTDGTLTNTWNYKDQLSTSTNGTFTRTYLYDEGGNRVSSTNGTTTTVYPNKYYTYNGTTKTKDIYAGDELVATITKTGSTVTPQYVHTDHVLGSNIITDASGVQNQLLDYFPYGQVRLNEQVGSFNEQKQYIGQVFDADTALNYLHARYYNSTQGRFISEDPQFWNFGQSWLQDPQNENSYSYGRDNPINLSDPSGKGIFDFSIITNAKHREEAAYQLSQQSSFWKAAMDHPVVTGLATGVVAGAAAAGGIALAGGSVTNSATAFLANGATGGAVNMLIQYSTDKASGHSSSIDSYAVAGLTGFAIEGSGFAEGVKRSITAGVIGNSVNQAYNTGTDIKKYDIPSLIISGATSALTAGTVSTVSISGFSPWVGKLAGSMVGNLSETAGQVINSGLKQ